MSASDRSDALRRLPSVDRLLARPETAPLVDTHGRSLTTDAIRAALDSARAAIRNGGETPPEAELIDRASELLRGWTRSRPRPVINATGVIIHTNLGRGPAPKGGRGGGWGAGGGFGFRIRP